MDLRKCGRCGLRVSAGICDTQPLVFHVLPEQCIEALKAELADAEREAREEVLLEALGATKSRTR